MNMNNNLKPFYIYTEDDNLYIKNINEETNKLVSNVHCYCAAIDDSQTINICCVDKKNKLIHMSYKHNVWMKKIISKSVDNLHLIQDMKLYITNKDLNVFLIKNNMEHSNLYNITHICSEYRKARIHKYNIDNILKDNEFIYKVNIDDENNIIFNYNVLEGRSHNLRSKKFNYKSKTWVEDNSNIKKEKRSYKRRSSFNKKRVPKTIKNSLNEYKVSIKYYK